MYCHSWSKLSALVSSIFFSVSHDSQLPKPLQHILIHPTQPLLLEPLLSPRGLHRLLDMLPYKSDKVDLMHRVRIQEVALSHIFRRLGLGGVVRLGRPIEATVLVSTSLS